MRISELARESGVAVPSIKYYLRENLLHAGEATGVNQARYDEGHVRRLRVIRALIEIGGLSIAAAAEVLAAVDDPDVPLNRVFGTAQYAVSQSNVYVKSPSAESRARVDGVLDRCGWTVTPDNPGRNGAANVADTFIDLGHPELLDLIDEYARAAEIVARADLRSVGKQADVAAMADTVVVGTVLGDAMFAALRRIAQEHVTIELYPVDPTPSFAGRSAGL